MADIEYTTMVKLITEAQANGGNQIIRRAMEATGEYDPDIDDHSGAFVRFDEINVVLDGGQLIFEYLFKGLNVGRQRVPAAQGSFITLGKFDGRIPVVFGNV